MMRVIECNLCGETVSAANDEELVRRLGSHMEAAHSSAAFDEDQAREMIAREAYTASDS
jgi:predicted small metal-binding protein